MRPALALGRDPPQRLCQCPRSVRRLQRAVHVRHAAQDREARRPASVVLRRAEARPGLERGLERYASVLELDHALGDDEPQVVLEPAADAVESVRSRITRRPLRVDVDVAVFDDDAVAVDVVRPRVQGPAARDVEARVVPVAVQQPVVQVTAMQRKAHVRATVIDREELLTLPQHQHRRTADAHDLIGVVRPVPYGAGEHTFGHSESLLRALYLPRKMTNSLFAPRPGPATSRLQIPDISDHHGEGIDVSFLPSDFRAVLRRIWGITSGLMEQLIHVAESSTQWVQLGLREDRPVWTTAGVRLAPGLWPFRRG